MGNVVGKKSHFLLEMEVTQLISLAKELQGPLKWDSSSVIRVGGQLAGKVNALQTLSGQDKCKLVCQVLKTVLEDVEKKEKAEEGKTEEEKGALTAQFEALRKTVDDVLPASLELALAAARGKIDLKKVKPSVWVRYVSCCARSVVKVLAAEKVISQDQVTKVETAVAAVETRAVEVVEEATAAAAPAEDKTHFEQVNPMHAESQEDAKTESKSEDPPKSE